MITEDCLILYLIVKKSLGMSIGKTAAQVAHAVDLIYDHKEYLIAENAKLVVKNNLIYKKLDVLRAKQFNNSLLKEDEVEFEQLNQEKNESFPIFMEQENLIYQFSNWKNLFLRRKVVLGADDKEFEKIKTELKCFVVTDAGLTELEPGTETVISLWPMFKNGAPKFIKKLQVLK